MSAGAHSPHLSDVQRATWLRYAQGVPPKIIAAEQCRSLGAIEARLQRVCDALGVETRLGLIKAAVEHGLLEPGEVAEGKPGHCPCCGDALPEKAMRALVESYNGHGYFAVAERMGITRRELNYYFTQLNARFGGRGAQHYVSAAVRSGLMGKLLNELDTPAARVAADGRRHADGSNLGGAKVRDSGHVHRAGGAVRAESAA